LAWTANQAFGHLAEDGSTFLASGLMPTDEFFATYERLSGLSVDPVRLRYYTVFNSYQLVVSAIASAYGSSAWQEPPGHPARVGRTCRLRAAAELRRCLQECL
jgi:aminoglycoside phosphotransferase (APT) family kinase protein